MNTYEVKSKFKRKREAGLVGRVLVAIVNAFASIFVSLVPRENDVWVFGNTKFFGDNPKYLIDYVSEKYPEIKCVWIASTKQQRDKARKAGYSAVLSYSLSGMRYTLKAGVGVVQGNHSDLNRFCTAGMHIVQLWHGFPLKRILLDHPEDWKSDLPLFGGILTILSKWALRRKYRASQVFAASQVEANRLSSAFGVEASRVEVTGTPREDIILEGQRDDKGKKRKLISRDVEHAVLYAPTYRRRDFSDRFWDAMEILLCSERLDNILRRNSAEMIVKLHPYMHSQADSLSRKSRASCRVLRDDGPTSVNSLLSYSDLLVTDYSSVAVDFALLERPIIFFCPDIKTYGDERGLYGEVSDIIYDSHIDKSKELTKEIGKWLHTEYRNKRLEKTKKLNDKLRMWGDGNSRCRITKRIISKLRDM